MREPTTSSSSGRASAGCVLANRLSADPKNRVLLLEAGGSDRYHWVHVPIGYLYCMGNPRTDWMMKTAAEAGLNGRSLPYPRGKVLGGCSSINGMIYMRGQAADYDGWRQAGNAGWGWDDVLPYFLEVARTIIAARSSMHGARRRMAGGKAAAVAGRSSMPSGMRPRSSASRRPTISTDGDNEGSGLLRGQPARRLALEHHEGLPAAGDEAGRTCGCSPAPKPSGWSSTAGR